MTESDRSIWGPYESLISKGHVKMKDYIDIGQICEMFKAGAPVEIIRENILSLDTCVREKLLGDLDEAVLNAIFPVDWPNTRYLAALRETSSTGAMACTPSGGLQVRPMSAGNFLKCFEPDEVAERSFEKKKKKKKLSEKNFSDQLNRMSTKIETLSQILEGQIRKRQGLVSRGSFVETTADALGRMRGALVKLREAREFNDLLNQADTSFLLQAMESLTKTHEISFKVKTFQENGRDFSAHCDYLKGQVADIAAQAGKMREAYQGQYEHNTKHPDIKFEETDGKIDENRFLSEMHQWCDQFQEKWVKHLNELRP